MNRCGIHDPARYLKLLEESNDELKRLVIELTINLSYFFRNPETFNQFRRICLSSLSTNHPSFWSAGCAAGEEPYTIAIILDQDGWDSYEIIGTDIDSDAISRAKKAVYNHFSIQFVPEGIKRSYFKIRDGQYLLDRRIVSKVKFEVNDLFQTNYREAFDVVFLRNVLIYLSKPAQIRLLKIISQSIKPKGFLILGKVETMIGIDPDQRFRPIDLKERIFQLQ